MKHYSCGFMFRAVTSSGPTKERILVALVTKAKPEWQRGKLNGVGGHIELSDPSADFAMAREFEEETGVRTKASDWRFFAKQENDHHRCNFFVAWWHQCIDPNRSTQLQGLPSEPVDWYDAERLPDTVIPNLKLLVPTAMFAQMLAQPLELLE